MKNRFFKAIIGAAILCVSINESFSSDTLITLKERVAIVRKHQNKLKDSIVVVEGPNGYKEVVAGKGITEQSQFFIGSISKQFTAVLILKALSEKNKGNLEAIKADLHKPLSKLLKGTSLLKKLQNVPEKFKDRKPKDWLDQVTLHDLLCHTSGLGSCTNSKNMKKYFGSKPKNWPHKIDSIQLIQCVDFKKQDVKKHDYCNTNFTLIAEIIEQLTGEDFSLYLRDKILKPFGLKDTVNSEEGHFNEFKERFKNLIVKNSKSSWIDLSFCKGTCSLISSAKDLMNWTKALHSGKVLDKDLYELMVAPQIVVGKNHNYGYGIGIADSINFGKMIFHDGDMDYYRSSVSYHPIQGFYIVALSTAFRSENMILKTIG